MSEPGKRASSSMLPDESYSEKNGAEPQPTNSLPFGSGSRLPMYSALKFEPCVYSPASFAVCVRGSSFRTRPREYDVGETYVPPPVIWQQWSSNSVISGEPG